MSSTTEPTTATDALAEYNKFRLAACDLDPNTVWVATMVDAEEAGADVLVHHTHAGLAAHLLEWAARTWKIYQLRGRDLGHMPDDLGLVLEALAGHGCAWVDIDPLTLGA